MTQKYPFQIRDHGDSVIEMLVDEKIGENHKIAAALGTLLKKFDFVILSLKETAVLQEGFAAAIAELSASGKLIVVAQKDEQIQVDLHLAKRYNDLANAQKRISGERNLEKILKRIEALPLIQSSAYKILNMLRCKNITFEEIEEVTSKDPKLVMNMLKIANSAIFMRRIPFENLKSIVTFLGLDGIKEIILQEIFEGFSQVFANQREKLAHMRRCAHLATYIGRLIGAENNIISRMNSAGLLHDIGSLALCFYDSSEYARATMKVRNDRMSIGAAEIEVFGIDHQELGNLMAQKIGMPDYLWTAVARHHDQTVPADNLLMMSVITANGYLNQQIENLPVTPYAYCLQALAAERQRNIAAGKVVGKNARNPSQSNKIVTDKNKEEEIFKVPLIYEVLKDELDRFMLAGTEAQGM